MDKRTIILAIMLTAVAALSLPECEDSAGLRVATFNVHNYPKHDHQRRALPRAIGKLDTPVVALQEVVDASQLESDVQRELGKSWKLLVSAKGPSQKVGVLYDEKRAKLLSTREFEEPILHPSGRPALEARFNVDGHSVRVMVLHLKAGGKFWALRAAQWWALLPLIEQGMSSGDEYSVVGDFNATGWPDRIVLLGLSLWTGGYWLSRDMPCSHYWNRGHTCETTPLDHALTSRPGTARAQGACATVGCDQKDQCPTWVEEVSDHCPVVVDF